MAVQSNPRLTAEEISASEKLMVSDEDIYRDIPSTNIWDVVLYNDTDEGNDNFEVPSYLPTAGVDPTYVADFFAVSNGKPSFDIPQLPAGNPHSTVFALIKEGKITVLIAKAYIWYIFQNKKGKLEADWISYKQTIGQKGAEVSIADILKGVSPQAGASPVMGAGDTSEPSESEIL